MKFNITLLIILLFCSTMVFAKQYYRYKNEAGVMIIRDSLDNYAILNGYDVISESGKLIQKVEPAKTLGELQEEKIAEELEKQKAIEKRNQLKRDAELLRMYSSVDDIFRARDSQVSAVQQREEINRNEQNLAIVSLQDQQRQAADYERRGTKMPQNLVDAIEMSKEHIALLTAEQSDIANEKVKVSKRFEVDIIRFKELKAKRMAFNLSANQGSVKDNNTRIITCTGAQECRNVWQLAQVYAKNNVSGRLEIVTDAFIQTSAPEKADAISISFSKLPSKNNVQIVFEVTCDRSDEGKQFCASNAVRGILDGFQTFVDTQLN